MSAEFDFEYGTWSVTHRRLLHRLSGCNEWEEFEGTTSCAPVLDGIGNVEQVCMPTIETTGLALRLFDQASHQWSIYWSSSDTGRLDTPVVGEFVDGVGTFEADDVFDARPIRVRYVWDQITPTSARWSQAFRLADDDSAWETNWVMDLARRD